MTRVQNGKTVPEYLEVPFVVATARLISLAFAARQSPNERRLPNKRHGGFREELDLAVEELERMTLYSEDGWELDNRYRDEE